MSETVAAQILCDGEGIAWTYCEHSDGTIMLGKNGNRKGCVSLVSITFNGNEPSVGSYMFLSCPSTCRVLLQQSSMWPTAGNTWNGMPIYNLECASLPTSTRTPDSSRPRPSSTRWRRRNARRFRSR